MSATGGAGLGKLTEIADNTDGLEITLTGVELNTEGLATSAKQDDIITALGDGSTAVKLIDESGVAYVPVGNLTLRGNVDTVTYSYILATFTRARNICYTVPAGKTLYVNYWSAGASTTNDIKVQTCRVMTRTNIEPSTKFKGSGMIFYPYTEKLVTNNEDITEFPIPTKLPAGTDIKVSAIGLTGFSGPVTTVLRG